MAIVLFRKWELRLVMVSINIFYSVSIKCGNIFVLTRPDFIYIWCISYKFWNKLIIQVGRFFVRVVQLIASISGFAIFACAPHSESALCRTWSYTSSHLWAVYTVCIVCIWLSLTSTWKCCGSTISVWVLRPKISAWRHSLLHHWVRIRYKFLVTSRVTFLNYLLPRGFTCHIVRWLKGRSWDKTCSIHLIIVIAKSSGSWNKIDILLEFIVVSIVSLWWNIMLILLNIRMSLMMNPLLISDAIFFYKTCINFCI